MAEKKQEVAVELVNLEVTVREVTMKDGSNKVFNSYKTYKNNGDRIDLRFTQECANKCKLPQEDCIIVVKPQDFNISTKKKYPILWVQNIVEIKPLPTRDLSYVNDFIPKSK